MIYENSMILVNKDIVEVVADPGFPRGPHANLGGGADLLFSIIFDENNIKMQKRTEGERCMPPPTSVTVSLS